MSFGTPSQAYYSAEIDFQITIPNDPFQSIPVYIALPKSTEGYSVRAGQFPLIVGDRPYLGGTVNLPKPDPSRSLRVRREHCLGISQQGS